MPENRPSERKDDTHFKPFNQFIDTMNRLFAERPSNGLLQSIDDFFYSTKPFGGFPTKLQENDREYIVEAQLPGVKKEQIDLEILPQYVKITVNQQETLTKKDVKKGVFHQEDFSGQSTRIVPLTSPIDQTKTQAHYENGILTITIPKRKGKKLTIE